MLRDLNHIQIQKNDKNNLFNKKGKQREATVIFLFFSYCIMWSLERNISENAVKLFHVAL